jgi:hypothetical protein
VFAGQTYLQRVAGVFSGSPTLGQTLPALRASLTDCFYETRQDKHICNYPLNAFRLVFVSPAFLAAEQRNIEIANARRQSSDIADRAAKVRRAFWLSALLVAIAFAVGALVAKGVAAEGYLLIPAWQLRLQALSAAVLLWGTVFVRGWDIQTYGGATLTERANRTLYLALYVAGTVLGVFATLCPVLQRH